LDILTASTWFYRSWINSWANKYTPLLFCSRLCFCCYWFYS
jgi:hypothetical protein